MDQTREALLPGTLIDYCGMQAEVIEDRGGSDLIVKADDGCTVKWRWTFEGESCTVVAVPKTAAN